MTEAIDRVRAQRERERQITARDCADPRRRARLERNPAAWLRHYMPGAFPYPWSKGHMAIIDGAIQAARSGTGVAVAAPRGEGKTTLLRGVSLYLVATGAAKFPLMAGWTHKAATEGFRVWLRMMHNSPELMADYPELTQPFEDSVHSARVKNLLWAHTKRGCGAEVRAADRCLVLPDSRGAIAAASVQGDIKGLSVTLADGTVLRPDLLLLDDVQDPDRAGDPAFVAGVVETIEKQWMCLAGPQSRITTMVACTVAAAGDVSEHFLTRPDFKGVRVSRVTSWPTGWKERGGAVRKAWDEWYAVMLGGLHDGDGGAAGRRHYRKHKAELTAGMAVSWIHRLDRKRKDPDALYSAMFDLYRIGEAAFASEYQNEPLKQGTTIYALTPDVILSRTTDRPPGVVPTWARQRIAVTDINPSYGLTWGVLAFGGDQTSAVLAYGIHEMHTAAGATQGEIDKAVYENLVTLGRQLAGMACRPEVWNIDASGAVFDTVVRFCSHSAKLCGLQALASTGRGARNYRPYGKAVLGKPREYCHMAVSLRGQKFLAWHADYWREQSQKAWTGSVGAPGSCSLPAGHHREFAEQASREQLQGKAEIAGQMVWVWNTPPGPHDYGDVMAMAYACAAWCGIGSGGTPQRPKRYVERRRCKVEREA